MARDGRGRSVSESSVNTQTPAVAVPCGLPRAPSHLLRTRGDEHLLARLRDELLSRSHFEKALEATRAACAAEIQDANRGQANLERQVQEYDAQINRLLELLARGNVSADTVEPKIRALEGARDELMSEAEGLAQAAATLDCLAEVATEDKVREYVERFETLLSADNVELMREFVGSFVDRPRSVQGAPHRL